METIDIEKDVLSNPQRPYFGIDPIDSRWDKVEIKPGFVVFFEENIIKKAISYLPYRSFDEYREFDTDLPTRDRLFVLPKTARGKEKKLNFTSVSTVIPTGCEFNLKIGSYSSLWVGNPRNTISLSLSGVEKFEQLCDFQKWRDAYIADSPTDHFEKIDRMRNLPHRTIKYYNGDIFRFEIGRKHYGFGMIIGQIRKMQKDEILPDRHALNDTMCVPLLVRFYRIKTEDPNISIDTVLSSPLLPTQIMADNVVLWGSVDIVGSKPLEADDIDFPMQVGQSISGERYFRFCWGTGMVLVEKTADAPKLTDAQHTFRNRFLMNGVSGGVDTEIVEAALRDESPRLAYFDICHPNNAGYKETVFRFFRFPSDMTLDEFNMKHGGMTRQQYAEYANKSLRPEKKRTP